MSSDIKSFIKEEIAKFSTRKDKIKILNIVIKYNKLLAQETKMGTYIDLDKMPTGALNEMYTYLKSTTDKSGD